MLCIRLFTMKENEAFRYIGDIPLFERLLNDVLSLTLEDWSKYKQRKMTKSVATINADTIPLIYDEMHQIESGIMHENYERFSQYIEKVIIMAVDHLGEIKVKQAMLTKLRANTIISRHRDKGPITAKTHRIHVPVITNEECIFTVGDESKNLKPGEIWVIDNVGRYHSVHNSGDKDRIHLIIDAA